MFQPAEFFKALPRVLLTISLVAAGLVALFVAWWIAVSIVIALAIWYGLRRLILHGDAQQPAPEVIEGEFEEVEEPPERLK
jgi:hypothetical protein